jgi:phage-related holin
MDNYIQMLYRPVYAMWDNLFLIIPSTVIAIGITLLDTFYGLIQVEAKLVMGLVILMLIDLISGIYKAKCNNRATTSVGLRQTSIKFVEYTLVSFAFVILSNMTDFLSFVSSMPFVFLSLIEIKSIVENLSDPKGVIRALFDHVRDAIAKRSND